MRLSLFGMLRNLAPRVQPAHLRQSRGLGKLLMLIARSVSEPRAMRAAAAQLLERMLPPPELPPSDDDRGMPRSRDAAAEARAAMPPPKRARIDVA